MIERKIGFMALILFLAALAVPVIALAQEPGAAGSTVSSKVQIAQAAEQGETDCLQCHETRISAIYRE